MARVTFSSWLSSPDAPLHLVFALHLLLTSWSHLGPWAGLALVFQDAFFLLALLWATHAIHSASPVIVALIINVLSIVLDIIALAVLFPRGAPSYAEFSAVMAIFNLIVRVLTTYVLFRVLETREDLDVARVQILPIPNFSSAAGERAERSTNVNVQPGNNNGSYSPSSDKPAYPQIPTHYVQHQ